MSSRIINKATQCEACKKEFNEQLKWHSKNKCNPCYQKAYLDEKYPVKRTNIKSQSCSKCQAEFGSKNAKGKEIKKGSRGFCRRCYMQLHHQISTNTCKGCGVELIAKRLSLCPICKGHEMSSKKWKRKVRPPHIVDNETFELIRRLLVRYKVGHNNYADAFRVVDVYMSISDNSNLLDNLREDHQIVEMLKWLKQTFDYNLQLIIRRKEAELEQLQKKELRRAKHLKKEENI